jgi:hypothetical protein
MADLKTTDSQPPGNRGLCGDCVHSQVIRSPRGSVFYQCRLSFADSRFVKYPRLPVLRCDGYKKQERV